MDELAKQSGLLHSVICSPGGHGTGTPPVQAEGRVAFGM
jgi:hypothetical protein